VIFRRATTTTRQNIVMEDQHHDDDYRKESSFFWGMSTASSMNEKDVMMDSITRTPLLDLELELELDLDFFNINTDKRILVEEDDNEDFETGATSDPTPDDEISPPVSAPSRKPTSAAGTPTPHSQSGHTSSNSNPPTKLSPTLSPASSSSSSQSNGTGGGDNGSDMQLYGVFLILLAVGLIIGLLFWRFCKAWKLRRERHMLRVQSTRVDAVLGDMQVRSPLVPLSSLLLRYVTVFSDNHFWFFDRWKILRW
jgi:hypothetical protein